jgi:hypothetical protein
MSDDVAGVMAKAMDSASAEGLGKKIEVPGKYVMRVRTAVYRNKEKEVVTSPSIIRSDKGHSSLVISLEVVDGTPNVPAGSYGTMYVILLPAPNSPIEKMAKTFSYTKPRLCALLGTKEIKLEKPWLREHLTIDYIEENGNFVVTRDHKMKELVYATAEISLDDNVEVVRITDFVPAKAGDKSIEMPVAPIEPHTQAGYVPVSASGNTEARPAATEPAFNPAAAASAAVESYEDN